LEIIGDSITAGDLVYCHDSIGQKFSTANAVWSDSWSVSYGARLGAALSADVSTVAWGGMGLIANDIPQQDPWPCIPDVYGSALAWDVAVRGQGKPLAFPFNFASGPAPDAVLIAIGTNDASYNRFANATFAAAFAARLDSFLAAAAASYARARQGKGPLLFLGVGPMSFDYAPAVLDAISLLHARGLSATLLNFTLPGGAKPACGHPSDTDHLAMAQIALPIVKAGLGW
jgi:hypothetical protein